jgi:murein DD-endopeptidase MepM/ murein hydrolase activator NlpD
MLKISHMKQRFLTRELVDMDELKKYQDHPIWNQGFTKGIYRFPLPTDQDFSISGAKLAIGVPAGELYHLGPFYAAKSPQTHLSPFKWATDFLVPDGTEILAADAGRVIEVVENFDKWGDGEEFRDKLNYLTIRHPNGEYSQYCHLAKNSFSNKGLSVSDWVKKGQPIALVGKTGYTDRDHLHFVVLRFDRLLDMPWNYHSLEVKFEM